MNRIVLIVALVVGLGGSWLTARAFQQYLDATEAFSLVELRHERGSFQWLDPEYRQADATFEFVNHSDRTITVDTLSLWLDFDGQFAGSFYEQWEPIEIPAESSREIAIRFIITQNSIRHLGGEANLSFRGQMRLSFANIEEPLVIQFVGDIGQVPYEEQ